MWRGPPRAVFLQGDESDVESNGVSGKAPHVFVVSWQRRFGDFSTVPIDAGSRLEGFDSTAVNAGGHRIFRLRSCCHCRWCGVIEWSGAVVLMS